MGLGQSVAAEVGNLGRRWQGELRSQPRNRKRGGAVGIPYGVAKHLTVTERHGQGSAERVAGRRAVLHLYAVARHELDFAGTSPQRALASQRDDYMASTDLKQFVGSTPGRGLVMHRESRQPFGFDFVWLEVGYLREQCSIERQRGCRSRI